MTSATDYVLIEDRPPIRFLSDDRALGVLLDDWHHLCREECERARTSQTTNEPLLVLGYTIHKGTRNHYLGKVDVEMHGPGHNHAFERYAAVIAAVSYHTARRGWTKYVSTHNHGDGTGQLAVSINGFTAPAEVAWGSPAESLRTEAEVSLDVYLSALRSELFRDPRPSADGASASPSDR